MTFPGGPLSAWDRAEVALMILATDPVGVGGLWLRARAGALRDRVTGALPALGMPLRRLHPGAGDDVLYGGIDLAATLATGHAVRSAGVLAGHPALVLAMAERCPGGLAARLGQWLDGGGGPVFALDEGAEADEIAPPALTERLGLFVDLDGIGWGMSRAPRLDAAAIAAARARLPGITATPEAMAAMVGAAAMLGIDSLRAPMMALRVARAAAALRGADAIAEGDLELAAAMVLAHRATVIPQNEPDQDDAPPPPPEESQGEDSATPPHESTDIPAELLLEAVRTALPADLLARLAAGRAARTAKGASGSGARHKGNRRGRPLPPRPGTPDGQSRLDPVATLRAAAPWQTIRRRLSPDRTGVLVRREDFRLRRFQESSDRVLIFTVDASGSAALARLAEAKGAVEILLGQAYARRDHVALVAFRGAAAEVMLAPTRSLVQTKRRLAGLPGGGGTPLAAGLRAGMELARLARGRGMSPTIALLTDGRANVALDGRGDRSLAMAEAAQMARAVAVMGIPALVIDTASRPQGDLRTLAQAMAGTYLPLPRADARRMGQALSAALGD